MEIYDNADSSYKAAGAETYHLPVLYTEDERSSYAAWGIKKEKLLMPFAIVTIIIDAFVLCATVVYLFEVQRQKPAFSVWLSCWGGVVGDVSYGVALVLTVLILKPLDWLFDKIMHRPEQPKMLQVTPKETASRISFFAVQRYLRKDCSRGMRGRLRSLWRRMRYCSRGRDCGSEAIRSHRSIRLRNRSRGWIIRRSR